MFAYMRKVQRSALSLGLRAEYEWNLRQWENEIFFSHSSLVNWKNMCFTNSTHDLTFQPDFRLWIEKSGLESQARPLWPMLSLLSYSQKSKAYLRVFAHKILFRICWGYEWEETEFLSELSICERLSLPEITLNTYLLLFESFNTN